MANPTVLPGDLIVKGDLRVTGAMPKTARSGLTQDTEQLYPIPWQAWRVWNAYGTALPATSAADDLGLYPGTWATNSISIQTFDIKTLSTSLFARCVQPLPPEYDDGATVKVRFHAGAKTTVSDTSLDLDLVTYKSDLEEGIGSDICDTAAIDINSLVLASRDFTITPTTLVKGDYLDMRVEIACVDSATATALIGLIGASYLVLDIKG